MRHWDEIAGFEREGFDIVVEKSYEELHPGDCFDDTCYDIRQICNDIDRGKYEWFILRVRAGIRGRWLAEEYLGACLYEDAREVLTDGIADDLISMSIDNARREATILQGLLTNLLAQQVEETV